MAAQGNALVGAIVIALAAWTTFARNSCTTNAGYWQCWRDSSPTTADDWFNGLWMQQQRTTYMLGLQMIWLSMSTSKILSADLKFTGAADKKKAAPAAGAPAAAGNSTADANSTAPANATAPADGAAPADVAAVVAVVDDSDA